jgi:nucleotide-binding universal stress UspA family protein
VLTYRAPEEGPGPFEPQTVLVPYDFSENASVVLPVIRFLAENFTPRFVFFFAIEPVYPFFGETAGHASYEFIQQTIKDAPKFAGTKFDELRQEELAGVNVSLEFGDGVPPAEIIERARKLRADLVVMATHGWTGFRHFFLGSVAETVVRKAPCSVLTVRSGAEG